jgi:hypothetical protein
MNELAFSRSRRNVHRLKKLNHVRSTIHVMSMLRENPDRAWTCWTWSGLRTPMGPIDKIRVVETESISLIHSAFRPSHLRRSLSYACCSIHRTGSSDLGAAVVLSAHFIKNAFSQLIWSLLKVDTIVWEPSMIS